MNRIAFLGAAAAALIALPAAAQSIHISTAGKSPAQVRAEVHKAATRLCEVQADGSTIWYDEMHACVDNTTRDTLAQSNDPNIRGPQR